MDNWISLSLFGSAAVTDAGKKMALGQANIPFGHKA